MKEEIAKMLVDNDSGWEKGEKEKFINQIREHLDKHGAYVKVL